MNEKNNIILSIIIPVYNSEKYIIECIESILNQTFKDFELILINDGSTDRSIQICDRYSNLYDNIKVIHKKNEGLSSARYDGLLHAKGDWISFIDNDDIIAPYMFELLFKYIIDDNIDIIGGKRIDVESKNVKLYKWEKQEELNVYFMKGKTACEHLIESDKFNIVTPLWGKIYRRVYFEKFNFIKNKKICPMVFFEDVLITPMLLDGARKTVFISEVIYLHREINTSISRSGKLSPFYIDQIYSYPILLDFLQNNKYYILYEKTIYLYCKILLRNWYMLINYSIKISEIEKLNCDIYRYYNIYYKKLISLNNISKIEKLSFILFKFNRKIWKGIVGDLYFKLKH